MSKYIRNHIYTYSTYIQRRFGKKIMKMGISLGIECPYRMETGGCYFCRPESFIAKYQREKNDIRKQLDYVIPLYKNKYGGKRGIFAYFQDNTSTAGNIDWLREQYQIAVSHPAVEGLIISTRPDYINIEITRMLAELNRKVPVFIELGMQSVHNKSLEFLGRGHTMEHTDKAINLLGKNGVNVSVHLILAIPGETKEDMRKTIFYINENPYIHCVKFHNLVVYKGTKMEEIYKREKFHLPDLKEYIYLLGYLLAYLQGDKCIQRLYTSYKDRSLVVAGGFKGDKGKWNNELYFYLKQNNIVQGSKTDLKYVYHEQTQTNTNLF